MTTMKEVNDIETFHLAMDDLIYLLEPKGLDAELVSYEVVENKLHIGLKARDSYINRFTITFPNPNSEMLTDFKHEFFEAVVTRDYVFGWQGCRNDKCETPVNLSKYCSVQCRKIDAERLDKILREDAEMFHWSPPKPQYTN